MLVRARILLPVCGPPVENGAVAISAGRVARGGRWPEMDRETDRPIIDLGDAILLPGLVNAHCHLDYTDMTGLPPQKQFPDWIKGLLALKAAASYTDYVAALLLGVSARRTLPARPLLDHARASQTNGPRGPPTPLAHRHACGRIDVGNDDV